MTDSLPRRLASALSELWQRFGEDPEALHLAVAVVYSSILRKHGLQCTIVGGQSAAYWLRAPGSTDVDLVGPESGKIGDALEECGFAKSADFPFRFVHVATKVLIEIVGEKIEVSGMKTAQTAIVDPGDMEDPFVRSLMPGSAEVLDPAVVFVNYCCAADRSSIWYDQSDEGSLAVERARALFALYEGYIRSCIEARYEAGELSAPTVLMLRERFQIPL